jgi:hypothetical protein
VDPSDFAASFSADQTSRAHIARRNRQRSLKDREFKLLRLVSGVDGISAYSSSIMAFQFGTVGGLTAMLAVFYGLLAALFVYVVIVIWSSKAPSLWLVLSPSFAFVATGVLLGAVKAPVLWLNVAALVATPFLFRIQRQIQALREPESSVSDPATAGSGL